MSIYYQHVVTISGTSLLSDGVQTKISLLVLYELKSIPLMDSSQYAWHIGLRDRLVGTISI